VEAAQSLGAGPLWILRRYLVRNGVTSVQLLPLTLQRCPTPYSDWAGLGFLGWRLPESIRNGAQTCSRLSTRAAPPASGGTALYPGLANVLCWYLGLSSWRGLEAGVSGGDGGKGGLNVRHCGAECSLQLAVTFAFSIFVANCFIDFRKEHCSNGNKPLQFHDQNCSWSDETLAQGSTPVCLRAILQARSKKIELSAR